MIRKFSAPGRTELAGNHTDHNRGKVFAAAVNLEITADVTQTDDNTVIFRSAPVPGTDFPDEKVELTDLSPRQEEKGTTASLIRGIAAEFKKRGYKTGGFSANTASQVLPGSGLSSSAAVEVLLVRIFDSLYGEGKLSPLETAQIGQIAENTYFGKPCGLMDQIACAFGCAVTIDFKNETQPVVKPLNFDLAALGYALCVVNTGGSHANLTPDYAAIPSEMKAVAAFFGKSVLGELEKETVIARAAEVRTKLGDRALLRCLHFFDENERVEAMTDTLLKIDKAASADKQRLFDSYLEMVNESGVSSWELLQNVYSPSHPETQGICTALALTRDFFKSQKIRGTCRVHGGGFAGTIQAYIPLDAINSYQKNMEAVFGAGSVTVLQIRQPTQQK